MKRIRKSFALGMLLMTATTAFGQWSPNAWSVQVDGGLLYDIYSPGKDQNIVDIPVKDMRSFYSDLDQFNPNINLHVTYASSPLWGITAGYGFGTLTGSNETDHYKAQLHSFDAGIKFFSTNLNPAMDGSKWALTPQALLSYTNYTSELSFLSDGTLQNVENAGAFGHVLGAELSYNANENWSFYGLFQHRTVYSDGLDGWDYGSGSDAYLKMNLGVKYRFTSKNEDAVNTSDRNLWSTATLAAIPSIGETLVGQSDDLEKSTAALKEEVAAQVTAQAEAAEVMSKELEQKMAELRKKDNELFEKVNQSAIFFASESARLTPEMRQELFKFQKNLEGSSWEGSYEVIITAFTDRYGDASYNANLREKRADAVVKYLQEELGLTVAVRRLTAAHDQLNDHILDRRVEVSVKVLE